jgi:hypothetical protein
MWVSLIAQVKTDSGGMPSTKHRARKQQRVKDPPPLQYTFAQLDREDDSVPRYARSNISTSRFYFVVSVLKNSVAKKNQSSSSELLQRS